MLKWRNQWSNLQDYYVTGKLDKEQACHLVKSIAEGCTQAGCALVGELKF